MAIPSNAQVKQYLTEAADGLQITKMSFQDFEEAEFTEMVRNEIQLSTFIEDKLASLQESATKQLGKQAVPVDYEIKSSITDNKLNIYWVNFGAKIGVHWKPIWSGKIRVYVYAEFE